MCGDQIRFFANGVSQAGLPWAVIVPYWITGYVRMERLHLNFEQEGSKARLACGCIEILSCRCVRVRWYDVRE